MKSFMCLLAAFGLIASSFADEAVTNKLIATLLTNHVDAIAVTNVPNVTITIPLSGATVTAPLVLTNGAIIQYDQQEMNTSGKVVLNFSIATAGNYVMKGIVNAPDESANSFFLNVDAQPEDPLMIWDFDVTSGFEERNVSWRGNGDSSSDEFSPKVFDLTAGEHKLIIIGRESNTELKSISIMAQPAH